MAGKDVKFSTRNKETYDGYISAPAGSARAPGLLLITAIFGTDDEMRESADNFAKDGFLVWTPDVFWRTIPGPTADFGKALERYGSFDKEQGLKDMEDLISALRADPQCNGKVAMLGYCFGGLYAHLGASRLGANAAGSFHGTMIGDHLGDAAKITCPVSYHYGSVDPIIPLDEARAVQKAFAGRANAEVTIHEGASHNFCMPYKDGYHPEAAAKARASVLKAFKSM